MHRVLAMVTVGVLVAGLALPTAALASSRPIEYLAVGDSLAFGFNPLVSPADADNYVGYPDFVAESLGDTLTVIGMNAEDGSPDELQPLVDFDRVGLNLTEP